MPLPLFDTKSVSEKTRLCIAIAAGKGGVGKSTVTVNIALALQEQGYRVGILDADLYGPSTRKMLPERNIPYKSQEGRLIPADCYGIQLISMAYFRKDAEASTVRAPIANQILSQFIDTVEWQDIDVLLVDFPPGTGDIQLTLCQKIQFEGAVVVTTPQEIALLDVRKAMTSLESMHVPLLGVVENMSYLEVAPGNRIHPFGKDGGVRLAKAYGIPLLGQVPLDPLVCERADKGFSLFIEDAETVPAADEFRLIAQQLMLHLKQQTTVTSKCKNITPDGPYGFTIEWNNGVSHYFSLSALQKHCPCAACAEMPPAEIPNLEAYQLNRVGQYGIRIRFKEGCSKGIYSFDHLYQLGLGTS